jgi:hypothetical protein
LGFERLEFSRRFRGHGSRPVTGEDALHGLDHIGFGYGELGLCLFL